MALEKDIKQDPFAGRVNSAAQTLLEIVESIEKSERKISDVRDEIKDKKQYAKGLGFDLPTIAKVLKARKKTAEEREQEEALYDTYADALNLRVDSDAMMIDDPLTREG